MTSRPPDSVWHLIWEPARQALRWSWKPFLLIQATAFVVVFLYYRWPNLQNAASVLAEWKQAGGLLFSFFVGGLVCAVMPELAKWATGTGQKFGRKQFDDALWTAFTYGWIMVFVDLMQQALAWGFGSGTDPATLFKKTFIDQFFATTLFFMPFGLLMFRWRADAFRLRAWSAYLHRGFWRRDVASVLGPAWAFWFPTLLAVYSMPTNLQFVFVIFCDAAWAMLFVSMAKLHAERTAQPVVPPP